LRFSALLKSEKSAFKAHLKAQKCANENYFAHFCALKLRISALCVSAIRKTALCKAQKCVEMRIPAI